MYRNGTQELRLTEAEYVAIKDVLDASVLVESAAWPARYVTLTGDGRTLDAVAHLLLTNGFEHKV